MMDFLMNLNLINMKKIIFIFFILIINISCSQNKNNSSEKQQDMTVTQFPIEKHIVYGINTSIQNKFDLFINDISAINNSMGYSTYEINPYVLKNGKYKIKIKFYIKNVSKDLLINNKIYFVQFLKDSNGEYIENTKKELKELKELTIKYPNDISDYFEQEWEVDIKDLPYELEGWSNGQDLYKMDQIELEKRVVSYYQKLWNILNDGNGREWTDLTKKRQIETATFDYNSEEELNRFIKENEEIVNTKCKNLMTPLEDYEMKLYANGKLVTLERKSHTKEFNNKTPLDLKGWSPLIRKYTTSGGADYPILLYLPQNSNEFVIIRK